MKNIKLIMKISVKVIVKALINLIYRILTLLPLKSKKIVFVSTRSSDKSENLTPLIKEIKKREHNWIVVEMNMLLATNLTQIYKQPFFTLKLLYQLATARFVVLDDYCLPLYLIKKREGVEVIQIWHAAGAFKKFGNSIENEFQSPLEYYNQSLIKVHTNYDKVIVSSTAAIAAFSEAFSISESDILPLGAPKTDRLFDNDFRDNSYKKFVKHYRVGAMDKKIILYAPTFREKNHHREEFKLFFEDFDQFVKTLENKNALMIIQPHPYLKQRAYVPEKYKEWIQINHGPMTTQELMVVSNAFITDFSSLMFDYSLLGKPMAFYMPDLADYNDTRGFYGNIINELPGPIIEDETELLTWISLFESASSSAYINDFTKQWFADEDGLASKRIIDYICMENNV